MDCRASRRSCVEATCRISRSHQSHRSGKDAEEEEVDKWNMAYLLKHYWQEKEMAMEMPWNKNDRKRWLDNIRNDLSERELSEEEAQYRVKSGRLIRNIARHKSGKGCRRRLLLGIFNIFLPCA